MQSTDAAGNRSPANLVSSWANKLQPSISYPRILAGPFGPTAIKSPSFSLQVRAASLGNSTGGCLLVSAPGCCALCMLCVPATTAHAISASPPQLCRHEGPPCPCDICIPTGAQRGRQGRSERSQRSLCRVRAVCGGVCSKPYGVVTLHLQRQLCRPKGWRLHLHSAQSRRQRRCSAPDSCLQLHSGHLCARHTGLPSKLSPQPTEPPDPHKRLFLAATEGSSACNPLLTNGV